MKAKTESAKKVALPADIRKIAFTTVAANSLKPAVVFKALLSLLQTDVSQELKLELMAALGSISSFPLATSILSNITLNTNIIRAQDAEYPVIGIVNGFKDMTVMAPFLWTWVMSVWDDLYAKYADNSALLGGMLTVCIKSNLGSEFLESVGIWKEEKEALGQLVGVNAALNQVRILLI